MGLFVFLFSNLYGNRVGAAFSAKVSDPKRDNPYFCRLMRQAGTIAVTCPTMSMVASILFNVILAMQPVTQLPAIWAGTVVKNFPMAFFWNMFAAAPFTRWLFGLMFPKNDLTFSGICLIIPDSVWRKRKSDFAAHFLLSY